jgi:hypothetical protein
MRLELHPTYRCNLACTNCNRACAIRTDHTPDITVDQWRACLESAPEPISAISVVGGEPTLHLDIEELVRLSLGHCANVRVFSNLHTQSSRDTVDQLVEMGATCAWGSGKTEAVTHPNPNLFVAPIDYGLPDRHNHCVWAASSDDCGYSVDSHGITACAIGGAIDGVLDLGVRTWDWTKVNDGRVRELCRRCGFRYNFPLALENLGEFRGQVVSPSWLEAARKNRGSKIDPPLLQISDVWPATP